MQQLDRGLWDKFDDHFSLHCFPLRHSKFPLSYHHAVACSLRKDQGNVVRTFFLQLQKNWKRIKEMEQSTETKILVFFLWQWWTIFSLSWSSVFEVERTFVDLLPLSNFGLLSSDDSQLFCWKSYSFLSWGPRNIPLQSNCMKRIRGKSNVVKWKE